jgi:hypothetical protein
MAHATSQSRRIFTRVAHRGGRWAATCGRVGQSRPYLLDRELVLTRDCLDGSPDAIHPTTVATSIRVPVMQGLPNRTSG